MLSSQIPDELKLVAHPVGGRVVRQGRHKAGSLASFSCKDSSKARGGVNMKDLVFSRTTQLAAAVRAGHVSATEVLEAHLAQIAARNPVLNAVVTRDDERAYERAREADAALARGEVWGPLHGVPFTLKDAHATAGMRTTTGFPPVLAPWHICSHRGL
jgi:hypothetical protein